MNATEIMDILPHRFPFLLVDKVIDKTDGPNPQNRIGNKVKAVKNVTFNEPFFQGHLPARPVVPGVLQIEAMAQAACLALYKKGDPKQNFLIGSIQDAKFHRHVVPGDILTLHAEIINDRGSIILVKTFAEVNSEKVAEAKMLAKVVKTNGR